MLAPPNFDTFRPQKCVLTANQSIGMLLLSMLFLGVTTAAENETIRFQVRSLVVDANEGIAAGDLDGDDKIDIAVAGKSGTRVLFQE